MYDDNGNRCTFTPFLNLIPQNNQLWTQCALARFNDIVYYAQIFDDQCKTFPRAP